MIKRIGALLSVVVLGAACSSSARDTAGSTTTLTGGATPTAPVDISTTTVTLAPTTTIATESSPVPAETGPSVWVAGSNELDNEVLFGGPENCAPFYVAIGDYTGELPGYMAANPDGFRCGTWNANGGQRTWTLTRGASGLFLAIIWQRNDSSNWVPMMRALEPAPGTWSEFIIAPSNIDSGPNDELVSGVRYAGSGGYLSLDIIDIVSGNPKTVAVYNDIAQGFAYLIGGGGVEIWEAQYADSDPNCCPSTFLRHRFIPESTGWFVTTGPEVPTGDPEMTDNASRRI